MKLKLMFLIIAILMLTGCFPAGEKALNTTNIKVDPNDSHINMELDKNVLVDANITRPPKTAINIYEATLKKYGDKVLNELFMNGREVKEKIVYNEIFHGVCYEFKDDYSLNLQEEFLVFDKKKSHDYLTLATKGMGEFRDDIESVFPNDEISNMKKDDAVKLVADTCEKLGIEVEDNPNVHALDFENLKKQEEEFGKFDMAGKHKRNWNKDDEAYMLIFNVKKDNIPMSNKHYTTYNVREFLVSGSNLVAIVNESGLIYFEARGIYSTNSIKENNVNIISEAQVLESVKTKFKNIIVDSQIKITNIEFKYIPKMISPESKSWIISPAWTIQGEESKDIEGKSHKASIYIMIDAITGNEIT